MPGVSDALVVALCVVAGLLVAPFLTTLIDEVPYKRAVRWPSLREHPPILHWVRAPAATPDSHSAGTAPAVARDVDDEDAGGRELESEGEGEGEREGVGVGGVDGAGGPLTRSGGIAVEALSPVLFALAGVRFGASATVVPFCVLFASLLIV